MRPPLPEGDVVTCDRWLDDDIYAALEDACIVIEAGGATRADVERQRSQAIYDALAAG